MEALYGLKSSDATKRSKLVETLDSFRYKLTESDPNIWMNRAVISWGEEYYASMMIYADDFFVYNLIPQQT